MKRVKQTEWRLTGVSAMAGVLALVMWTVWHDNASRPCLYVAIGIVAVAVIDIAWATVTTKRTRIAVLANPAERYVGDVVDFELDITGPRRDIGVRIDTLAPQEAMTPAAVPARQTFRAPAGARAHYREITVQVVGFGLTDVIRVVRRHTVGLAQPLWVGPRPIVADHPVPDLFRTWGDGEARPSHTGDVVRGVRSYVPGDPIRHIHWRASARTGELVVKEVDETGAPRLTIALDMGGGGVAGEQAAGRTAWYAFEALQRGYDVTLLTVEARETVRGPIGSVSDVIRRLASATATGPPQLPAVDDPAYAPAGAVLLVTFQGDAWR